MLCITNHSNNMNAKGSTRLENRRGEREREEFGFDHLLHLNAYDPLISLRITKLSAKLQLASRSDSLSPFCLRSDLSLRERLHLARSIRLFSLSSSYSAPRCSGFALKLIIEIFSGELVLYGKEIKEV
ncbi:uncharacterized protein LOC110027592 [Phalaenopsis equestris]|uniref:uncharacterized protein LOC110027592 n=1 Tax=Phalaenopsis equestris TaxID=78828 RepID=UPI0009E56BA3|nr:uncharacterized protein LOC110027592 [Phalaenopsis equestris]